MDNIRGGAGAGSRGRTLTLPATGWAMAAETRTARRPVVLQRHLESGRRSAVPGTAPRLKAVADIANVSVSRSVALMSRADASARTRSARVSGRFGCDERALRRNRRGYRCVRRAPRRMRPDRRCPGLVGSARKRAPAGFRGSKVSTARMAREPHRRRVPRRTHESRTLKIRGCPPGT